MNGIPQRWLGTSLAASMLLSAGLVRAEPSRTGHDDSSQGDARPDHVQPNCIRDSGTRIKPRNGECVGIAGRSYSNEDLQRNGAINAGDALRRIDPTIGGASR